jgi:heme exporter protein A
VTETAIAARDLGKRFGPAVALRALDLDVVAGTSVAVLGPNGAGKTTLLRLIAGLARPSSGSLTIAGQPAGRREARARVGLIGHSTGLYAALTARENLLFAARLYRVRDPGARVDELLAETGLERVAQRPAGSFSHGMARRLSIARGLVHDPEVVLLDEPFTGLDRRAADGLTERLTALRRRRRTVVLVTHDVFRAVQTADSAIVLAGGRKVHESRGAGLDPTELEDAYLAATEGAS